MWPPVGGLPKMAAATTHQSGCHPFSQGCWTSLPAMTSVTSTPKWMHEPSVRMGAGGEGTAEKCNFLYPLSQPLFTNSGRPGMEGREREGSVCLAWAGFASDDVLCRNSKPKSPQTLLAIARDVWFHHKSISKAAFTFPACHLVIRSRRRCCWVFSRVTRQGSSQEEGNIALARGSNSSRILRAWRG